MPRLFIALVPSPRVGQVLASLREEVPGARWLREEALHVTLQFLGEVADVGAVEGALVRALRVGPRGAVPVVMDERAAFPDSRRARVLVVTGPLENELAGLQREVAEATAPFVAGGTERHPRFRPHVTLARLKGTPADAVQAWVGGGMPEVAFDAHEVVLFESLPGSDYRPLFTYSLGSP
ncbi:MAG TPA: RNA 2',3'-cyclic phosphodiesterase [Rhodothermales bacterium]|nr:RNA 2',3'-cyclic phosphodiesterase [Rhodothermales bacterium]